MEQRGAGKQSGFTLVEVLVAFAILVVSLGVLMPVLGDASVQGARRQIQINAASYASQLLATQYPDNPMEEETRTGRFSSGRDLHWTVSFVPYGEEKEREGWVVAPYEVFVSVTWQDDDGDRSLEMATLRLEPKLQ